MSNAGTNLTLKEEKQIHSLKTLGYSVYTIAAIMGRSKSTIRRVLRS